LYTEQFYVITPALFPCFLLICYLHILLHFYCFLVLYIYFVSDPPEIDGPGDSQRAVLEGGDITLVCGNGAIGNPTPTISWMNNNGTTVSDGSGISGSDTLMLTITSVTRNHTGNWTCSVENSIRNIKHQIMLVVFGEYICVEILGSLK